MPHKSRLAGFIIDCQTDELEPAARFWEQALGMSAVAGYDSEGGIYAPLDGGGTGLHIEVQKVSHASRVHLDIETDDIEAEATRLEKLGAKRIAFVHSWWVMEAPTGQRFCVVQMKHPERGAKPNEWGEPSG